MRHLWCDLPPRIRWILAASWTLAKKSPFFLRKLFQPPLPCYARQYEFSEAARHLVLSFLPSRWFRLPVCLSYALEDLRPHLSVWWLGRIFEKLWVVVVLLRLHHLNERLLRQRRNRGGAKRSWFRMNRLGQICLASSRLGFVLMRFVCKTTGNHRSNIWFCCAKALIVCTAWSLQVFHVWIILRG